MPDNTVTNKDVLIDPVTKKWLKGTASPNPGGRPNRKKFTKLLKELFTDEIISYMLFCKANGINTSLDHNKDIVKLISQPEVKNKFRKYLRKIKPNGKYDTRVNKSKLSERDQVDILKWVAEFAHGKSTQQIQTEVTLPEQTNININFVKSK